MTRQLDSKSYYQFYGSVALGDKYNRDLQGQKWYPVADQMLFDPVIGGITWMIKSTINGATWEVQEGGTEAQTEYVRQLYEKDFNRCLDSAIKFLWYGSYAFEQIFYLKNGLLYDRLIPRQPHTFQRYEREGNEGPLRNIRQTTVNGSGDLPIEKTILLIRDSEGWQNLNGQSLMIRSHQPWLLKNEHRLQDLYGAQRFANGTLHLKMADTATKDDYTKAENIARSYSGGNNSYVITSPDQNIKEITVINAGGTPYDAEPKVQQYNKEIAMAMLSQFLVVDGGSLGGAQELVREFMERFYTACQREADDMANQFNEQRTRRMLQMNFSDYDPEDMPKVTVSGINKTSPHELAQFVQQISGVLPAGFFNAQDLNLIKKQVGLTPFAEDTQELSQYTNTYKLSQNIEFFRELTALESFVKFDAIIDEQDKEVETLKRNLESSAEKASETYINFLTPLVLDGNVEKINELEPRNLKGFESDLKKTIQRMRKFGEESVIQEAKDQGKALELNQEKIIKSSEDALNSLAEQKAIETANALALAVKDEALGLIGSGADLEEKDIRDALETSAQRRANAMIAPLAFSIPAMAYSSGRAKKAAELEPKAEFYSAIMDMNTCGPCAENDGKEIVNGQPAAPNPNCLGKRKCRCVKVYEF